MQMITTSKFFTVKKKAKEVKEHIKQHYELEFDNETVNDALQKIVQEDNLYSSTDHAKIVYYYT